MQTVLNLKCDSCKSQQDSAAHQNTLLVAQSMARKAVNNLEQTRHSVIAEEAIETSMSNIEMSRSEKSL